MNGHHTAILRSFGTTGVLLLLALVLLAIVSAIVAFDRWPDSGGASTVERVAVDRPDARRVETVLVRSRRSTPVVRGVFVARAADVSASALGAGDVLLVGDREPADQSDGGGFGPPPPPVPSAAPGEGGGPARFVSSTTNNNQPAPPAGESPTLVRQATCEALGAVGAALDPACEPGQRGTVGETAGADGATGTLDGVTGTVVTGTELGR